MANSLQGDYLNKSVTKGVRQELNDIEKQRERGLPQCDNKIV